MITLLTEGARQGRDRCLRVGLHSLSPKIQIPACCLKNPTKRIRKYSNDFKTKILQQNSHHFMSQDIHFSKKLACSSLWAGQVHETHTWLNLGIENAPTQE